MRYASKPSSLAWVRWLSIEPTNDASNSDGVCGDGDTSDTSLSVRLPAIGTGREVSCDPAGMSIGVENDPDRFANGDIGAERVSGDGDAGVWGERARFRPPDTSWPESVAAGEGGSCCKESSGLLFDIVRSRLASATCFWRGERTGLGGPELDAVSPCSELLLPGRPWSDPGPASEYEYGSRPDSPDRDRRLGGAGCRTWCSARGETIGEDDRVEPALFNEAHDELCAVVRRGDDGLGPDDRVRAWLERRCLAASSVSVLDRGKRSTDLVDPEPRLPPDWGVRSALPDVGTFPATVLRRGRVRDEAAAAAAAEASRRRLTVGDGGEEAGEVGDEPETRARNGATKSAHHFFAGTCWGLDCWSVACARTFLSAGDSFDPPPAAAAAPTSVDRGFFFKEVRGVWGLTTGSFMGDVAAGEPLWVTRYCGFWQCSTTPFDPAETSRMNFASLNRLHPEILVSLTAHTIKPK